MNTTHFLQPVAPHRSAVLDAPPEWMGFLDPNSILVLTHPDAIKHVLQDNHANYVKGALYDGLRRVVGQGLITSDGESWVRNRKLAQPAFRASAIETFHPVMVDTIRVFLQELQARARPGRAVDVSRETARLTLRVLTKATFRLDIAPWEDRLLQAIVELLTFDPMSRGPILGRVCKYFPLYAKLRVRKALADLEDGITWIIGSRSGTDDVLSYFGAGPGGGAEAQSNQRVRDEVATFLIAGHETSALALTWALYLLSQHPEAEQRIRVEVIEVLGGRAPAPADVPRLTYTGMVVQETLRLYPSIPTLGRQAVGDDAIAGFRIPAGTLIRIKVTDVHRRADVWPEPERFLPERFAPEQAGARPYCAFLPFGGGPRACIGNGFAMLEMKLALAMIVQVARFTPAPRLRVDAVPNITLRPRFGMWMIPEFFDGRT